MFRTAFIAGILLPVISWSQATNYVSYAAYQVVGPTRVAPGQVITLFVRGLNVPTAVPQQGQRSGLVATTLPLPRTLGGLTVVVKNPPTANYPTSLPIFSVLSYALECDSGLSDFCDITAVTVQFPFEPVCIATFPNPCQSLPTVHVAVQTETGDGQDFSFSVETPFPHILNSCDAIFGLPGDCYPLITHADGTLVYWTSPARRGEEVTLYAVGLGPTQGNAVTGQASASADPIGSDFYLDWGYLADTPPGPLTALKLVQSGQYIKADFAGLVKGYVGLYQINFRIPDTFPQATQPQCAGQPNETVLRFFLGPTDLNGNYRESLDICVLPQ